MTNRKLLAALRVAHRHWHAAAVHREAAWNMAVPINMVQDQLSPSQRKQFSARWAKIMQRKSRKVFIIPDELALTIKTLEGLMR
jgi:hypothetical protein